MIGDEAMMLAESNAIENVFDEDSLLQAYFAWKYLKEQKELTHGVILKTHKILMLHQKLRPDEKGYYRKKNVGIYKEKIIGVDPIHNKLIMQKEKIRDLLDHKIINEAMQVWLYNANLFPENWRAHHIRFEEIHPFIDGNGRIGRMLMNWERLKKGFSILIISADPDKKKEYYEWFK